MRSLSLLALALGSAEAFLNGPCAVGSFGAVAHRTRRAQSASIRAGGSSPPVQMILGDAKNARGGCHQGLLSLRRGPGRVTDQVGTMTMTGFKVGDGETRSERAMRHLRDVIAGLPVTGGYHSISDLFLNLDKDSSGGIDMEELTLAFKRMGAVLTPEQMQDIHYLMDVSGDGLVDWGEFEAAMEMAEAQLMDDLDDNEVMNDDTF